MTTTRVVLLAAGVVGVIVVAKKYLTPGVYVEEVPEPPRPIQGVGTSTAARTSDDPEKPEKGHDDAFDLLHPHGRSKPEKKKPEKPEKP